MSQQSTITTRNMARRAARGATRNDRVVTGDSSAVPSAAGHSSIAPDAAASSGQLPVPVEEARVGGDSQPHGPYEDGRTGESSNSSNHAASSEDETDESSIEGEHPGTALAPEGSNPSKSARGRRPANDGLVKPDTSALSPDSKARIDADFKRKKNAEAQRRLRQRRKEAQQHISRPESEWDPDALSPLLSDYPVLAEMGNSGDVTRQLSLGSTFDSKQELVVRIRSVAEYFGRVDIVFSKSDSAKITVHSISSHADFNLEAHYNLSTGKWGVSRANITTRKGSRPSDGGARTAYKERDLAGMLRKQLQMNPAEQVKALRTALKPYLRFADDVKDNQIFRARAIALADLFGRPGDNIKLLPVLKDEFERKGHRFGYNTIGKSEMLSVLESVAEADYRRASQQIKRKPVTSRTAAEIKASQPWNPAGKDAWLNENADFLASIPEGNRYVELVWVAFSHTLSVQKDLLLLANADAAHGKRFLDSFQLFVVVGFTSNMNIVPLLYVYLCGNESKSSWSRVFKILKKLYPALSLTPGMTFLTDQEKGLHSALNSVLGQEGEAGESRTPKQMVC